MKQVLYAEDNQSDALLMARAFKKLQLLHPLRVVPDGEQAIAYLAGAGAFANRDENPLPSLILLDLSMPGKTGLEVLQWIRTQPLLADLPVIVLTSSNQQSDFRRARVLGASGYLIKPGDPEDLLLIVKTLEQFWLSGTRPTGIAPGAFIDVTSMGMAPLNEHL